MWLRTLSIALILVLQASAHGAELQQTFDEPVVFKASEVLSSELRKSENHEVGEYVTNDGFMNNYVISSPFGTFEARGAPMLRIRVHEVGALAELDGLSKTKVFVDAAAQSALKAATAPITAATAIVTNPVGTVTGLPGGVKRMFSRQKRKVEGAVDTTKSVAKSVGEEGEEGEEGESLASQTSEGAKKVGKSVLGTSKSERRWAKKLGTDPYTTNETLRAAIADVAVVDSAGNIVSDYAVPIGGIADLVVEVNDAVWERDSFELRQMNIARLLEMGVAEEDANAFLDSEVISPSVQTLMISGLDRLGDIPGRDLILRQATEAEAEDQARFYLLSTAMLAWLTGDEHNVAGLTQHGPVSMADNTSGALIAVLPLDYLTWTPIAAEAVAGWPAAEPGSERWVYLAGGISDLARKNLNDAGWQVRTDLSEEIFAHLATL
ncbi:MAG: hypothetical protein OES38_05355 [Gammaproteobacteria bacterium]|nr:hypothetical protein [Gammaproteobacteria bacterium]